MKSMLPMTAHDVRWFRIRLAQDWLKLVCIVPYSVASVWALSFILPDGAPVSGLRATAFFIGYMVAFCGGLCVMCRPRKKARRV